MLGIWQSQSEIDQASLRDWSTRASDPSRASIVSTTRTATARLTSDDRVIIGTAEPDFTGGFSTAFRYKGLTLSANFVFTYGNQIFNGNSYELSGSNNYNNAYKSAANRWKPTLYYYDAVHGVRGDLFMEGNPSNTLPGFERRSHADRDRQRHVDRGRFLPASAGHHAQLRTSRRSSCANCGWARCGSS